MLERDLPLFYLTISRYRTACRLEMDGHLFTPNECAVILFLLYNPEVDVSREIAQQLGISSSLVSRSVDSLTALGYLKMEQDREDRRVWHLCLTPKSQPLIGRVEAIEQSFQQKLLQDIPEEDLKIFRKVMEQMVKNLQDCETEKEM